MVQVNLKAGWKFLTKVLKLASSTQEHEACSDYYSILYQHHSGLIIYSMQEQPGERQLLLWPFLLVFLRIAVYVGISLSYEARVAQ